MATLNIMKKGASQIISTVLLISITITLAAIILAWGNMFFVALSPPANCDKVNFRAGIFESNLDIRNKGNKDLRGFVIKKIERGSIEILKEINLDEPIKSGYSYTTALDISGNLLIVPIIQTESTENKIIATCSDKFGVEVTS